MLLLLGSNCPVQLYMLARKFELRSVLSFRSFRSLFVICFFAVKSAFYLRYSLNLIVFDHCVSQIKRVRDV